MKKKSLVIIILVALALAVVLYLVRATPADAPIDTASDSIVGCYQAKLGSDVYSLGVASQSADAVRGTMVFKNFEKDSSYGTFNGTYQNGILLGDYTFNSEGSTSVMQVIFQKTAAGFIRGYGPMNETGDRFSDMNAITYDQTTVFTATAEPCPTAL